MIHTGDTLTGSGDLTLHADVIIVGSGAGGSPMARELTRRGLRVIVFEEGPRKQPHEFTQNTVRAFNMLYQEHNQRVMRGNAFIPLPGGRVVGGSTVVNSAITLRAPETMFAEWRTRYGLDRLTRDAVHAAYTEVEHTIGVGVSDPQISGRNNQLAYKANETLKWDGGYMPRNAPGCMGCGVCHFGCPSGAKQSVDKNFLAEAVERGAEVYADTRIERILTAKGRAIGVSGHIIDQAMRTPTRRVVATADAVILSCSAVGTAALLQRNKLGGGNNALGEHLHVHPGSAVAGIFADKVESWRGIPQGFYAHHPDDHGILIQSFWGPPEALYANNPHIGHRGKEAMANLAHMAGWGAMISDTSTGRVRAGSPTSAQISYDLNDHDLKRIILSQRALVRMMFTAGAQGVYLGVAGNPYVHSIEEAETWLLQPLTTRDMFLYASHPMASCRMGPKRHTSVVNTEHRVHDVENLFIADGSVFPTSLGVNPQMTIMMLSLLGAPLIADQIGRG